MNPIIVLFQPIYKLRVNRVLNKHKDKVKTWHNTMGFGPVFSKDYVVLKNKVYIDAYLDIQLTGTPKHIYVITSVKKYFGGE